MPDIAQRQKKEAALESLLRRALKTDRKRLVAALGNPPDVANVPDELWEEIQANIEKRTTAALALLFLMGTDTMRSTFGYDVDPDRAGANARRYGVRQGKRLARQTVGTLRGRLRVATREIRSRLADEADDYDLADATADLGAVVRESAEVSGRAAGVTETTAANGAGERHYANEIERQGGQMVAFWRTEEDERVCFPAGTTIQTDRGGVDIETIRQGDLVSTRYGLRKVLRTIVTKYDGDFVRVRAGGYEVDATKDHPFWTRRGWVSAQLLHVDDFVQTIENKEVNIDSASYVRFSETDKIVSGRDNCRGFFDIARFVSMPIVPIDFYSYVPFGNNKINAVIAYAKFLNVGNADSFKGKSNIAFQEVFPAVFSITREFAELTLPSAGRFSEVLTTSRAAYKLRWASTPFGTKSPISFFAVLKDALFSNKNFAAFFTSDQQPSSLAASHTTGGISIGLAAINRKRFIAYTADFCNFVVDALTAAFPRTTNRTGVCGVATGCQIERSVAGDADFVYPQTLAFLRDEFELHVWDRHNGIVYPRRLANATMVYNLAVEEHQEYYANGLLVHNCNICRPLNWTAESEWPPELEDGPPGHISCRCWTEYRLISPPTDDSDVEPEDYRAAERNMRVGWVSGGYDTFGGWGAGGSKHRSGPSGVTKVFDESKVNRDDHGKFALEGGGDDVQRESTLDEDLHSKVQSLLRLNQTGEKYLNRLKNRSGLNEAQVEEVRQIFADHDQKLKEKGEAYRVQKERDDATHQAVAGYLNAQFGLPDSSDRSEAGYWRTPDGIRVRVASHAPIYARSTSHVNVVTGGASHPSWFNTDTIPVDIRGKEPAQAVADVTAAIKEWQDEKLARNAQGLYEFEGTPEWRAKRAAAQTSFGKIHRTPRKLWVAKRFVWSARLLRYVVKSGGKTYKEEDHPRDDGRWVKGEDIEEAKWGVKQ